MTSEAFSSGDVREILSWASRGGPTPGALESRGIQIADFFPILLDVCRKVCETSLDFRRLRTIFSETGLVGVEVPQDEVAERVGLSSGRSIRRDVEAFAQKVAEELNRSGVPATSHDHLRRREAELGDVVADLHAIASLFGQDLRQVDAIQAARDSRDHLPDLADEDRGTDVDHRAPPLSGADRSYRSTNARAFAARAYRYQRLRSSVGGEQEKAMVLSMLPWPPDRVPGSARTMTTTDVEQIARRAADRYEQRDPSLIHDLHASVRFAMEPDHRVDWRTEAELLNVLAKLWREQEGIGTLWLHRRLVAIAGPSDPLTLPTYSDAAIIAREHGYLGVSERQLQRGLVAVEHAALEGSQAARIRADLLAHLGGVTMIRNLRRPGDAYARAQKALDAAISAHGDAGRGFEKYKAVLSRRRVDVDLLSAAAEDPWRAKRLALPFTATERFDEAARENAFDDGSSWPISWQLTAMAVHLLAGEREGFIGSATEFARRIGDAPWYANLKAEYTSLLRQATTPHGTFKKGLVRADEVPPLPPPARSRLLRRPGAPPPRCAHAHARRPFASSRAMALTAPDPSAGPCTTS